MRLPSKKNTSYKRLVPIKLVTEPGVTFFDERRRKGKLTIAVGTPFVSFIFAGHVSAGIGRG